MFSAGRANWPDEVRYADGGAGGAPILSGNGRSSYLPGVMHVKFAASSVLPVPFQLATAG